MNTRKEALKNAKKLKRDEQRTIKGGGYDDDSSEEPECCTISAGDCKVGVPLCEEQ
ncbi:hypothetical protein [Chryseobacterium sp. PMSZPI]|uniref:hypothetical protein n=1 Tax=Chryseobacterium sp. PMSZPI TaxID=1033900 RepID=UPI001610DD57|nr:hypothetical protein [Chryseobacterium sp. PMSZPI]